MNASKLQCDVSFEEALQQVLSSAPPLGKVTVSLTSALGRIPTQDQYSDIDVPPIRIPSTEPAQGMGAGIGAVGEETKRGDLLHRAGFALDPIALSILASCGCSRIETYHRPRVAILTIGSGLERPGSPMLPELPRYECDSALLMALLFEMQVEPILLSHQGDDFNSIRRTIDLIGDYDMIIASGGAAYSEAEILRSVLGYAGAKFLFERVQMKPAGSTGYALWYGKPVFCLPGNPVGVFVAFQAFIAPFLMRMSCRADTFGPSIPVRLGSMFEADAKLSLFIKSSIRTTDGGLEAHPDPETGPDSIRTFSESAALIAVPPGSSLTTGSFVTPLWMRHAAPCYV